MDGKNEAATRKLAGNGVVGPSNLQAGPQWAFRNCGLPGLESNPSGGLILRKLLIPRNNKMEKTAKTPK